MSETSNGATPRNNYLLAKLPESIYQRLQPHLRRYAMVHGDVLGEANQLIPYAYFPTSGIISLVVDSVEGPTVEVGVVGQEGLAGVTAILGGGPIQARAMVQVRGQAWRMPIDVLQQEFKLGGPLQDLLHRYIHTLLMQSAQVIMCNRVHSVEERLSRWLLQAQDRLDSNHLELTHEYISDMLGVRRSGVTIELSKLRERGFIEAGRGYVNILNRDAVEDTACECYGIINEHFQWLTP